MQNTAVNIKIINDFKKPFHIPFDNGGFFTSLSIMVSPVKQDFGLYQLKIACGS